MFYFIKVTCCGSRIRRPSVISRSGLLLIPAMLVSACAGGHPAPLMDHHQHLFSPDMARLLSTSSAEVSPITAADIVPLLDAAGIQRALLLSIAYIYGSPNRQVDEEYAQVRAENDWVASQAGEFPDRLQAFCSFNPLRDYALEELERCSRDPRLGGGIKLHFGNSDVQLEDPDHLEQVGRVFRAANDRSMAIVIHLRASISMQRPYGPTQAQLFLDHLMPLAADVPVQIAHLAGAGPGYTDTAADSVMEVLANAVEGEDPRTRHLLFDVTTLARPDASPEEQALLVYRIRQVGPERVLYGSDAAIGNNLRPREGWEAFLGLHLTDEEFRTIAGNVAPYWEGVSGGR